MGHAEWRADAKGIELKELGIPRRNILYTRLLSGRVASVVVLFESLALMTADLVRSVTIKHMGVGTWTSDIYLSECLLHCDLLPKVVFGLQEAYRVLKGLEKRPMHEELESMTEQWRPWRTAGARMLWKFYQGRTSRSEGID